MLKIQSSFLNGLANSPGEASGARSLPCTEARHTTALRLTMRTGTIRVRRGSEQRAGERLLTGQGCVSARAEVTLDQEEYARKYQENEAYEGVMTATETYYKRN